jgi:hypothetical protein
MILYISQRPGLTTTRTTKRNQVELSSLSRGTSGHFSNGRVRLTMIDGGGGDCAAHAQLLLRCYGWWHAWQFGLFFLSNDQLRLRKDSGKATNNERTKGGNENDREYTTGSGERQVECVGSSTIKRSV